MLVRFMFMLEHHPAYQHRPKEMNIKAREPLILQVSACLDGAGIWMTFQQLEVSVEV